MAGFWRQGNLEGCVNSSSKWKYKKGPKNTSSFSLMLFFSCVYYAVCVWVCILSAKNGGRRKTRVPWAGCQSASGSRQGRTWTATSTPTRSTSQRARKTHPLHLPGIFESREEEEARWKKAQGVRGKEDMGARKGEALSGPYCQKGTGARGGETYVKGRGVRVYRPRLHCKFSASPPH